jgi:drug/metabolite transporter (DMT)-like permease
MIVSGGQASALALLAAGVWGAADFSGGVATKRATPATVLMIAHGLSLLILLLIQFGAHAAPPTHHTVVYGLFAGLAGGIGLLALYQGLSMGSMGLVAALSGVLTAALPVVVSFFSESRPTLLKICGFLIAGVAIWLIAYTPGSKVHPLGLGMAVLSGFCFGLLLVFLHIAGKDSVLWALTFSRIGSTFCAVALGLAMIIRKPKTAPKESPAASQMWRIVLPLAAAAGILDTTGNLLYTFSSLAGRLDIAAVLSSLYPAGTILLAIWLLRERATRKQTAGMALALLAVAMISA